MTATHFSDVLAAFSASSSDVILSSVSASAPLVFSDSEVDVDDSEAGSADEDTALLSVGAAAFASRRLVLTRVSFFACCSLSSSSFSAFYATCVSCKLSRVMIETPHNSVASIPLLQPSPSTQKG